MKFSLDNISSLKQALTELATGLRRLDLLNNFRSFEVDVLIPAASELTIRNQLTKIPSGYIIRKQIGNAVVTASSTEWDINYIHMQNHSLTEDAQVKILFME
jgi:hypothetical protein